MLKHWKHYPNPSQITHFCIFTSFLHLIFICFSLDSFPYIYLICSARVLRIFKFMLTFIQCTKCSLCSEKGKKEQNRIKLWDCVGIVTCELIFSMKCKIVHGEIATIPMHIELDILNNKA